MILVIEDDKTINNLLCKVLSDSGYETDCAFDGEEGLNKALNTKCDMILLDLMLPIKTGEEVLREVRKVSSTPAIVLSAKDFLLQPFQSLLHRILFHLSFFLHHNKTIYLRFL